MAKQGPFRFSGKFKGLLKGEWEYTDEDSGVGNFFGKWLNKKLSTIGSLKGRWKTGLPGDGKGYFHGIWYKDYDDLDTDIEE